MTKRNSNPPPMKWKIRLYLSNIASFLEIFLAMLLALTLAICSVQVIPTIFRLRISMETVSLFHEFLEALFELVIGVEALKLLCKHTPGSALEVLLFTIAREMIVTHTTPEQNLIVVISIAILFAIRRFMYVPAWGSEEEISAFDEVRQRYREFRRRKDLAEGICKAQRRGEHKRFRQDRSSYAEEELNIPKESCCTEEHTDAESVK